MLKKIIENRLLLVFASAIALYWLGGLFIPSLIFSTTVSLFLLIFGGITFLRYAPSSFEILFKGIRNEDAEGSHLAALGVTSLALGSVYVGLWSLTWNMYGQPLSWISTPSSLFGRGMMGLGFLLLFISPDVSRKGLKLPEGFLIICLAIIALMVAFFMGTKFDNQRTTVIAPNSYAVLAPTDSPGCTKDRPIMGNVSGSRKIYHMPSSPYRSTTYPERCFATEDEAKENGFMKSKT